MVRDGLIEPIGTFKSLILHGLYPNRIFSSPPPFHVYRFKFLSLYICDVSTIEMRHPLMKRHPLTFKVF